MAPREPLPPSNVNYGSLRVPPVFAAPLAGITDYSFRMVLRDFFSGMAFTEMLSAEAAVRGNKRTLEMAKLEGGLTGIQLVGGDPKRMAMAAEWAENLGAAAVDINAGCPDPHITKKGGGAALLKNPDLLFKTVSSVKDAVKVPVSIKMRSGWRSHNPALTEIAEEAGADLLFFHPRLENTGYRLKADHTITAKVVEERSIPVVASGDILSSQAALEVLVNTSAAGVLAARGMRGDPQLPWRIQEAIEGRTVSPPSDIERCRWLTIHARHCVDYFGEEAAMKRMRKHALWYLRGIAKRGLVRDRVNDMSTMKELEDICRLALSQ
ncbi:MAG: tRNA-dihydrouridine synthase [Candidatus Thermoplasmatota archaeon]|nr:tRNA-dihydrouridine synthase [Candidatus Thermoplasmatota archaeon]